jgi:hypothetical protein
LGWLRRFSDFPCVFGLIPDVKKNIRLVLDGRTGRVYSRRMSNKTAAVSESNIVTLGTMTRSIGSGPLVLVQSFDGAPWVLARIVRPRTVFDAGSARVERVLAAAEAGACDVWVTRGVDAADAHIKAVVAGLLGLA